MGLVGVVRKLIGLVIPVGVGPGFIIEHDTRLAINDNACLLSPSPAKTILIEFFLPIHDRSDPGM